MAIVKERGTITFMSDVQSGMSQNGNPWYRQTIVVDVAGFNGSYRKVALQASGNLIQNLEGAMIGDKVDISYQVTAREWNGNASDAAACCTGISAESAESAESAISAADTATSESSDVSTDSCSGSTGCSCSEKRQTGSSVNSADPCQYSNGLAAG